MNYSDRPLRNDDCGECAEGDMDYNRDISNVVEIENRRQAVSNQATQPGEKDAKDVIERWKEMSPHIKRVIDTYAELGINTEPLGRRMLEVDDQDVLQIIIQMREFTALILKALELRVDNDIHVIRIHPHKRMGRAALEFAERQTKDDDNSARQKLNKMYEWLRKEEANEKVVKHYNKRCKPFVRI